MDAPLNLQRLNVRRRRKGLYGLIRAGIPLIAMSIVSVVVGGFVGILIALGLLSILAGAVWLVLFSGRHRTINYFSADGIGFADGTEVPWSNLLRVVDTAPDGTLLWTELEFNGGRTGMLVPDYISNFEEVYRFVKSLGCEQTVRKRTSLTSP